MSARWTDGKTKIFHIPEYYNWDARQEWLQKRGINEVVQPVGIHEEFSGTAIMMLEDPATVRMQQRLRAGHFTVNGVDLAISRTLALGREDWVADLTATHEAIRG